MLDVFDIYPMYVSYMIYIYHLYVSYMYVIYIIYMLHVCHIFHMHVRHDRAFRSPDFPVSRSVGWSTWVMGRSDSLSCLKQFFRSFLIMPHYFYADSIFPPLKKRNGGHNRNW